MSYPNRIYWWSRFDLQLHWWKLFFLNCWLGLFWTVFHSCFHQSCSFIQIWRKKINLFLREFRLPYVGFHFGTEGKQVFNVSWRSVNSCILYTFLLTCRCLFFFVLNIHAFMMLFLLSVIQKYMWIKYKLPKLPTLKLRNFNVNISFKSMLQWLDFRKTSFVFELSDVH